MAYFEWKEEYSVHIVQIDTQHKQLVKLLNELFDAMQAGKGKEVTGKILSDLVDYTRVHFQTEERLLQSQGYPALAAHQQEHAAFTRQVEDFLAQFKIGRAALSVQISGLMKNWLNNHILQTDQRYSEYLTSHGVK